MALVYGECGGMIREYGINPGQKPTEEQLREIEEAAKKPIVPDEDCPELSPAMYKAFKCAVIRYTGSVRRWSNA